jgi:hypothetical protein
MDVSIQPIAVDVLPVGIDGGRGGGVAGVAAAVDLAGSGTVLVVPDLGAGARVRSDDIPQSGGDEDQIDGPFIVFTDRR